MASSGELGNLELDDLLGALMQRAGEVIDTQRQLRDLIAGVRALQGQLTTDIVIARLVSIARDLMRAQCASFVVDPSVRHFGEERFTRVGDNAAPDAPEITLELISRGEQFGTLCVQGRADGGDADFDDDERQVLRTLVAAAALAVQNAQNYEALARRRAWTAAFTEITSALLNSRSGRNEALELICRRAVELAGGWYSVVILPIDHKQLLIEVGYGEPTRELIGVTLDVEHSISGVAMRTKEIVISEAPSNDPRAWAGSPATTRTLLIPMVAGGISCGVISLTYFEDSPPPTEDDLELLRTFAGQAALALEFSKAQTDRAQLAVLEDRDRIGAELHDLVIQRIFAIGMSVQSATRLVDQETAARLTRVVEELDATIRDLRQTVFELDRGDTDDLSAEIDQIVNEITGSNPQSVTTEIVGDVAAIAADTRTQLLAVVREALSNAVRHAHADTISIAVVVDADLVMVAVADDGVGVPAGNERRSGTGNMDQRARALGGEFSLLPRATGGTIARWSVPLHR